MAAKKKPAAKRKPRKAPVKRVPSLPAEAITIVSRPIVRRAEPEPSIFDKLVSLFRRRDQTP